MGYGWDNLWGAPLRLAYPFTVGLLIYRVQHRLARMRLGLVPLSIVMTGLFCFPSLGEAGGIKLNALYDLFCVSVMFPLILVLGIHSEPAGWRARMAHWFGRISYPLYITHFPTAFVFLNYTVSQKPSPPAAMAAGVATFVVMVVFAWSSCDASTSRSARGSANAGWPESVSGHSRVHGRARRQHARVQGNARTCLAGTGADARDRHASTGVRAAARVDLPCHAS
ncbi:acyltransferase [Xanthomonas melonis]|uniref:acyltransferase family protein n=1 Tax=Xanthomonas melonis TaxID=56456 RepID=UPI002E759A79|nr:acyltransferase [Xanthomonas melonis]